jgi:hypothetical protein
MELERGARRFRLLGLRPSVLAGLVALSAAGVSALAEDPQSSSVVVTLGDGTTLPLVSWSLSYEYQVTPQGGTAAFGATTRREARDLFVGKKSVPTSGGVLEIQYRQYEQSEQVDGQAQTVKVAVATGMALTAGGKKTELHLEPPHKDLLVPQGAEKGVVQARALDLTGMTLTGTKRSFCLLSYAAQVECHPPPAERVVKLEFGR